MFGYKIVKEKDLKDLYNQFYQFQDYVWDNASLTDSRGKSEPGNYNKKEVDDKWEVINASIGKIFYLLRKIKGK